MLQPQRSCLRPSEAHETGTTVSIASFALYGLYLLGYTSEAIAFKDWLEWSTAGRARDLRVVHSLGGERRLSEVEVPGLSGHKASRPVRIGNGAYSQFQLDVYGELMDSVHLYRKCVGEIDEWYLDYLSRDVRFVLDHWNDPDESVWNGAITKHATAKLSIRP